MIWSIYKYQVTTIMSFESNQPTTIHPCSSSNESTILRGRLYSSLIQLQVGFCADVRARCLVELGAYTV
jgi:hypothetical protein